MIAQLSGRGAQPLAALLPAARRLGTLVLVELKGQKIETTTLNTLTAARALGNDITVLVAGEGVQKVAEAAASLGVKKVLLAQHAALKHQLAEPVSQMLKALQDKFSFTHILAPGSTFGKNVLPRAAALLDIQPVSDVMKIVDKDTFIRPIYAGNGLATVRCVTPGPRMMTVRPSAFPPGEPSSSPAAVIEEVEASVLACLSADMGSQFEGEDLAKSERPELGAAKVVVCGGRGLKSKENFKLMESLADTLGGAVGASRAAVDAGFVPNDLQVGQTGKVVAPDLYFGVGISGAIQHLAGMKDSKTIVAINNDPEAPIFQVADYGLVQDLFTAVPELEKKLKELQAAK